MSSDSERIENLIAELVAAGGEDLAGRQSKPTERAATDDETAPLIDELIADGGEDLAGRRTRQPD